MLSSITQGKGLFMFLRAQLSAQIATFIDFIVSIMLKEWCGVYYVYATLCGSITGGLTNCAINYKWTFRTTDCSPYYVMFKYILVWLGSIGINIWGTYLLTELLKGQPNMPLLGESSAFIIAKIIIAVMVAVLWNYNLHRMFVFRNTHINQKIKKRLINIKEQHGNKKTS